MVKFVIAILLSLVATASASLCQQSEAETWNYIQLYGFVVDSDQNPVKLGSIVYYSFRVKNIGGEQIKIGKGGIYLKTSLGDQFSFYAGETIQPGKELQVKSSFKAEKSGKLTVNPGICLSTTKGDVCHDFNTSCSFDVVIECPAGWSCLTAEDASKTFKNYLRYSDEICGYKVSTTPTAVIKTPMYCYREVFECPQSCQCLTQAEANKEGLILCGEKIFCGLKSGEEMYCFQRQQITTELPDLVISDVWPFESSPGVYSEIRALVYNLGRGYATNSTLAFFVDGINVGEVSVKGLGSNENVVVKISYQRTCSGENDVFEAIVDYRNTVNESNENNNRITKIYNCTQAGIPDLQISKIRHDNESDYSCTIREYNAGHEIEALVRNSGNGTSPDAIAHLYIDGIFVASSTIPSLNSGEERIIKFRYNGTCSGNNDTIKVVFDPDDRITELNEGNNALEVVWNCIVSPSNNSDLRIYNASLIPIEQFKWRIVYEIRNDGSSYACGSHTGLYIDEILVADDYVDRIAPGESLTKTFWRNYTMTECTPPSDTIKVMADYRNEIMEITEDNNNYTLSLRCEPVPTTPPQKPDLVVLNCHYSFPPGTDDVTITCRIMNQGYLPSPPTTVEISTYQYSDTENLRQLNPGESVDVSFDRLWHPRTTTLHIANYSVQVVVDPGNLVDEIPYETNNIWSTHWEFPLTCNDGIKNRDEEGVDCGGRYCIPCNPCDPRATLPSVFDWRDYYRLPPVRDQGGCGSCWAFATIGAMEIKYLIQNKISVDLSEQYLVSDCGFSGNCSGSHPYYALDFIKNNYVLEEVCLPYQAIDSVPCTPLCTDWQNKRYNVTNYREIKSGDVQEIKRALICHGPLIACSGNNAHAVVIVGYNDSLGAWIIRNSYGIGYGDNGYGYILYGRGEKIRMLNESGIEEGLFPLHFKKGDGLTSGDLNGDGIDEIIFADRSSGVISVFNNRGSTIYTFQHKFNASDLIATGNVDLTVAEEIIHASIDEGKIYVLYSNNTTTSFSLSNMTKGDGLGVGDVDRDGVDEIIYGSSVEDKIKVFNASGHLKNEISLQMYLRDYREYDGLVVENFFGDDTAEIIYTSGGSMLIYNLRSGEEWRFSFTYNKHDVITAGDVDGDGDYELIYLDFIEDNGFIVMDKVQIYGLFISSFSDVRLYLKKEFQIDFYFYDKLAVGDVDKDGKEEIIHGENTGNTDYRNYIIYITGVTKI
ncbi:MAG: CARDB domain-containing protein [Archaeoglobaceae archaeon]